MNALNEGHGYRNARKTAIIYQQAVRCCFCGEHLVSRLDAKCVEGGRDQGAASLRAAGEPVRDAEVERFEQAR